MGLSRGWRETALSQRAFDSKRPRGAWAAIAGLADPVIGPFGFFGTLRVREAAGRKEAGAKPGDGEKGGSSDTRRQEGAWGKSERCKSPH